MLKKVAPIKDWSHFNCTRHKRQLGGESFAVGLVVGTEMWQVRGMKAVVLTPRTDKPIGKLLSDG